ncbi:MULTISPECIES: hypothetical protein [Pseudomonas]|uniref:Uncharacterized protein n=1 Tax=Pseudomonas taiwanensis TaxID=470150 RepID=A0ABR6V7A0_9PSED|nr:hypothetical protein [Pseudomonas taiwanensis]MBC3476415.1 hypothetical protein [Pseudomonas taiwanensis]MBC3490842.1 hypothetical protein [Pseudomonas taiwanensis]
MSSEQHVIVGDAERVASKKVDPVMKSLLENVSLECGAEGWSFITIVMPDERIGDYPEVKRYHKTKKDIEVRVQLPTYEFKDASRAQQVDFMLDALSRSVDMMSDIKSLKLTKNDAQTLKGIVEKARLQLRIT